MDSGDLAIFAAVARMGSITKAAQYLETVQSNVTQRVRRLEDELGVSLFYRHGRGVSLTATGSQLLPYASRIAQMMDEARRVALDQQQPTGPLSVGSMETTAALRLSGVLVDFATEYPQVDLMLKTGPTHQLIEDVVNRSLEGALVAGPVDHIDLVSEPVVEEELVIVTAPWMQSPAGDRPSWVPGKGEVKIVVFRNGCSYRERLERVLVRQGVTAIRKMELGTLDGILACVRAGIAVTMLPMGIVKPLADEQKVTVHRLAPQEGLVETVFIRRRDAYVSSSLTAFMSTLHRHSTRDYRGIEMESGAVAQV
ncbi:LysR substrate-binding domain-containing protein [Cupriavidus sp. 2SB]|uniref:LysR substrate-binding domain-containing protein n=1 Tax=Cupriavidus sp. 2SB TaxID=2502199 RepID=UPI0010F4E63A|nr:LysR substrate-binding domain-containing protein [Cupriavidus sp. 2SB]